MKRSLKVSAGFVLTGLAVLGIATSSSAAVSTELRLDELAQRELGEEYGCVVNRAQSTTRPELVLSVTHERALRKAWRLVRRAKAQSVATVAVVAPRYGYQRLRRIQKRIEPSLPRPDNRVLIAPNSGPGARTCSIVVWILGEQTEQQRQRAAEAQRRWGADRIRLAIPEDPLSPIIPRLAPA